MVSPRLFGGMIVVGALASIAGCQLISGLSGLHEGSGGHGGGTTSSASGTGGASTTSSSSSGTGGGTTSSSTTSSSSTTTSSSSTNTTSSSSSSGSCTDDIQNGNETDVDCGGGTCPQCPSGKHCAAPGDCAFNVCAIGGICGLTNGSACVSAMQCQSGFCVDGVCCNKACNGTCQTCTLPSSTGTCAPVPATQADPDTCPAPASACDGAGNCRFGLGLPCMSDTACGMTFSHCIDGVCCNTVCGSICQACNVTGSAGTCANVPAGVQDAPNCQTAIQSCDGAGVCRFTCSNDMSCAGYNLTTCVNGLCQ